MNNPKILVAGIGGVGGLMAGQLIRAFGSDVTLLARGEKKEHLLKEGLTVNSDNYGNYTVHPANVVENTEDLSEQDLILVCVKNPALLQITEQFKSAIGKDTIIMPVMNGVSAAGKIHELFPEAHTMMSVIYTVSMIQKDFSLRQLGTFTKIYAGPVIENETERKLCREMINIISNAGINIEESEDVQAGCWDKYVLNSAYNGITAAYGVTIGDIKKDDMLREEYRAVMQEAYEVGLAMGVHLKDNLIERHMKSLDRSTDDSTSSLSRDFDAHIWGEAELFSKDIADMGRKNNISTPHIDAMYDLMLKRRAKW